MDFPNKVGRQSLKVIAGFYFGVPSENIVQTRLKAFQITGEFSEFWVVVRGCIFHMGGTLVVMSFNQRDTG